VLPPPGFPVFVDGQYLMLQRKRGGKIKPNSKEEKKSFLPLQ